MEPRLLIVDVFCSLFLQHEGNFPRPSGSWLRCSSGPSSFQKFSLVFSFVCKSCHEHKLCHCEMAVDKKNTGNYAWKRGVRNIPSALCELGGLTLKSAGLMLLLVGLQVAVVLFFCGHPRAAVPWGKGGFVMRSNPRDSLFPKGTLYLLSDCCAAWWWITLGADVKGISAQWK